PVPPAPSGAPVPEPPADDPAPEPTPSPSPPAPTAPQPVVTVSPQVISAGEQITASYRGAPGETLTVLSKTQPATAFSAIRTVTLDATGRATTTHRPQRNTRLTARRADGTTTSVQPLVQVRSVASLSARRTGPRTYRFTGRVYPARDQRVVSLYRAGRLAGQGRTGPDGVYAVVLRLPAGPSQVQARTGDDTYNLGSRSRTLTISAA
ncbi:MAG: hypothetical protein JWO60_1535, partial [Frankiales bacterium]|nr:hypothetical protein [Frankiales bacterium]